MGRRRGQQHPLDRLAVAMGAAAANIHDARFRKMLANDAQRIPVSNPEIGGGRRGEMARLGRKTLASLKDLVDPTADQLLELQQILRGCRDAVQSRFEVISEVKLGERRRRW